jgi:hypothetical protein
MANKKIKVVIEFEADPNSENAMGMIAEMDSDIRSGEFFEEPDENCGISNLKVEMIIN